MIVLLNGPLGVGKTTLAEALTEAIDGCVMLDGDHLVAVNPPPEDEVELLHATVALLVGHYRARGYRHFVIPHLWRTADEIEELRARLADVEEDVRCFLLTLSWAENLRRIEARQAARVLDETAFELQTVREERALLASEEGRGVGELFDVSGTIEVLVETMLTRLKGTER